VAKRFIEITQLNEVADAATDISFIKNKKLKPQNYAAAAGLEKPNIWAHPPGPHEAFPHTEPALDASHIHPQVRKDTLHAAYHDDKQHVKQMAPVGIGSLNNVFRGEMSGGQKFISKPHEDLSIDPDRWHGRHEAQYRILGHMGASHMSPAGIDTKVHDLSKLPTHTHPGNEAEDPAKLGGSHAGNRALVTSHVEGRNLTDTHPNDIANIDADHRLHGLVSHILMGNNDGHSGNVMVSKDKEGKPYPVLIDQDLALNSGHDKVPWDGTDFKNGKEKSLNSVFAPGRALDYTQKMGEVGTNFPHRMKKTLEWLASGGHRHPEHGIKELHPDDAVELQNNASTLLKHGLEGTLAKRDLAVPNKRASENTKV
jgi:hypothetical protein